MIFTTWAGRVSVRSQQHRLDDQGRLFDMLADPGQSTPLNDREPDIAARLTAGRTPLADGRAVSVRPVQPDDAGMLAQLLLRLSPRSCHQRYLAARAFSPDTAQAEAERIVAARTRRHIALVAVAAQGDGDELLGVAELARLDEGHGLGELAVMVRDDMQRAGIGALLMDGLAAAAPPALAHAPTDGTSPRAGETRSAIVIGFVSQFFAMRGADPSQAGVRPGYHLAPARARITGLFS